MTKLSRAGRGDHAEQRRDGKDVINDIADETSERAEVAHEMQKIDYDSGGYIIPCFPPFIDGHTTRVKGIAPARVGRPLFNYDFKEMWLT